MLLVEQVRNHQTSLVLSIILNEELLDVKLKIVRFDSITLQTHSDLVTIYTQRSKQTEINEK